MKARAHTHIGNNGTNSKKAYALWQRGLAQADQLAWSQAAELFDLACDAEPSDVVYRLNLARALLRDGQIDESLRQARIVLDQDKAQLLARHIAGECLIKQGANVRAAELLMEGHEDAKGDFEYLHNLGLALYRTNHYREAISVLMDAIGLRVDHAESYYQLAMCFQGLQMLPEAVECLETVKVLGVAKGELACYSLLAFFRRECCDWEGAASALTALMARVQELPADENQWVSVFASVTLTDEPDFQRKAAQICAHHLAIRAKPMPNRTLDARDRRIRLGFVSADFHHHATTILMAELLERLDRSRFDVHLYSHGVDDGSAMRQRIKAAATVFVDAVRMSDLELAQRIRDDGIDVLIDLKGHTSQTRLGAFGWRPAPIQVSFLGFPGTTGASYIDYFIGDQTVSPIAHAGDFTEKLALMPHSYQPNDRQRPLPQATARAAHGLPDDALVLCGFNQPFKLTPEVLDVWCDLLHELPRAVLWLLKWNVHCEAPLRAAIVARGIAPERLILAPGVKPGPHVSRFALADIFLDAWPCNGHTTVSDALWAGVPVVTLQGRTFVSRVASSLLKSVGLPAQCVTTDIEAYKAQVLKLAHEPALRRSLHEHLVAARTTAPLFDTDRYADDFAALIERMVARHEAGLPPDHLDVQPQ
jgi:predicted O-linked N-acetylglucosamine transferase (SPINDLY family)